MNTENVIGCLFMLPLLGALVMTVMPRDWQSLQGWLLVSYLGLPGIILAITLAVYFPPLLFGGLFLLGVAARGK